MGMIELSQDGCLIPNRVEGMFVESDCKFFDSIGWRVVDLSKGALS